MLPNPNCVDVNEVMPMKISLQAGYCEPWQGAQQLGTSDALSQWGLPDGAPSQHMGARTAPVSSTAEWLSTGCQSRQAREETGLFSMPPVQGASSESYHGFTSVSWSTPRWHKSAESVGVLSQDDHIFMKIAGPRQKRTHDSGEGYELATICMVFDASLRCGGVHSYRFCFMDGELGLADGAGFVFDTRVRRRPLGQMRAVFLNQRGIVCLRRGQNVSKLPVQLPRLTLGMLLTLSVNLDQAACRFDISDEYGQIQGSADVGLQALLEGSMRETQLHSGFFCAVVTGNITVGLF